MNPSDKITVEMERGQWVAVCNMLAEQPYKLAAPLIGMITARLAQQRADAPSADNAA